MVKATTIRLIDKPDDAESVWSILRTVPDPETPVLNVVDLSIVRYVRMPGPEVGITPTYTGCPATEITRNSVVLALRARIAEAQNRNLSASSDRHRASLCSVSWLVGSPSIISIGIRPC